MKGGQLDMKKNFMLIAVMAIALFFAAPMVSEAAEGMGWQGSDATGWWYGLEDGSEYYADGFYEISGATYCFDASGYMATEWEQIDDEWYYFGTNGVMVTEWEKIDGVWYYFNEYSGWMYDEGIWDIDGEKYIFEKSGANASTPGWYKRYSEWYYIKGNGAIATGWATISGEYYCFSEWGYMYSGGWREADVDGQTWLFDEDGVWKGTSGWNWANDAWYYLIDANTPATKWRLIDGEYYWFESDEDYSDYAQMYCGTSRVIGDVRYFFEPSGAMVTGWYNYANAFSTYPDWVYCNADGSAYTGWLGGGKDWYYINNGYMETGWFWDETSGKEYYFGRDGKMVYGWYYAEYKDDTGYFEYNWFYTDPTTGEVYEGWVNEGGKWYYISSGWMCYADVVRDYTKQPEWDSFDIDGNDSLDYEEYMAYEAAQEAWEKTAWIVGADGTLVSGGWYTFSNTYETTWFYANADGTAYDGWLNYGGAWYYIDMGYMVTNQFVDGCWIGADGIWR